MGRLYIFICLCLGMFGCMASNLKQIGTATPTETGRFAATSTRENASNAANTPANDGSALILDRQSDGHFYADVAINGTEIRMLVDTGASGIALAEDDARRAGIATTIGMNNHIGEGAGGAVYGDVVDIDSVRLGGVEVEDVRGVVLAGGDMSLLGQSFLSQFRSVEIQGDVMVLR